jgi:Hsp70 protein
MTTTGYSLSGVTTARLCADFGTSNTVAVLHQDGRSVPLLFDGSPLLPSAVYLAADAELLVGRDAERSAGMAPERLEPNPKRRIDDGTAWLGDRELPVAEMIAAVLRRVVDEAVRVAGRVPDAVLTHPAGWAGPRMAVLAEAAGRAGLADVRFVAEPVAAASYFVTVLGHAVPAGRCVVVYDLGAGTFDVAVVQRTGIGFEVLATGGLPDVGGLDLDAAIVGHLRTLTAASGAWGRLDWPESAADRRARRLLWADARAAKEQLSRHASAELHVPLVEADLHLIRDEFEKLARPLLDRTVATTTATLRAAGVGRESVAGIFLVGGSSRIPLAASLLHRTLDIAPTVLDQPELVVAAGATHAVPTTPVGAPPADRPSAPAATGGAGRPEWTVPDPTGSPSGAAPLTATNAPPPGTAGPVSPTATGTASPPTRHPGGRLVRTVRWLALLSSAGYGIIALYVTAAWAIGNVPISFSSHDSDYPVFVITAPLIEALVGVAVWQLMRRAGPRAWAGAGLAAGFALLTVARLPVSDYWYQPLWGEVLTPLKDCFLVAGEVLSVAAGALAVVAFVRARRSSGLRRPARPLAAGALVACSLVTAMVGLATANSFSLTGARYQDSTLAVAAVLVLLIVAVAAVRPVAAAVGLIAAWLVYLVDSEVGPLVYWPLLDAEQHRATVAFLVANLVMAVPAYLCLRGAGLQRRVGEGGQGGVGEYPDAVGDG